MGGKGTGHGDDAKEKADREAEQGQHGWIYYCNLVWKGRLID